MGLLRLIAAPLRHIANSRLFQLVVIVTIILLLDHYSYDYAGLRSLADGLKILVTTTVQLCSQYFRIGMLTDPVLQVGLMIVYVYIVCLLIVYLLRITIRAALDLIGSTNFLWLRSTIARERGIAAYRAWLPLEKIRPAAIPQEKWEEMFAWPADNKPPYPPLPRRILSAATSYLIVIVVAALLLQIFTPFPVLTWLGRLTRIGSAST
jgi:hypothetical protein